MPHSGGAQNAWAVGFYRSQAPGALPLILHWNGTSWSQVTAPASGMPQTELNGVSTVSGRDAWAAGFAGKPAAGLFGTLLLHGTARPGRRWPAPIRARRTAFSRA